MSVPRLRKTRPFGMPQHPLDPMSGKMLHFGDVSGDIVVMDVIGFDTSSVDFYDVIWCRKTDLADDGQRIIVYKPYMLRRSPFDQKTVDEIAYDYAGNFSRTATGVDDGEYDGEEEDQFITPPYLIGEQIIAVKFQEHWVDLNNAGRCWAAEAEA